MVRIHLILLLRKISYYVRRRTVAHTLYSDHITQHDPTYTDYPINSYVLYTAPTGSSDKLELKHRTVRTVLVLYVLSTYILLVYQSLSLRGLFPAVSLIHVSLSEFHTLFHSQNWYVRENECFGIFYGVHLFEDLLDNRPFILKTDHMNLTYLNVTLTGKVLRWKLYLQGKDCHLCHVPGKEVHQGVPDALSRLCENHIPVKQDAETRKTTATLSALQPKQHLSDEVYDKIAAVHNSSVGNWGQAKCRAKY